MKLPLLVVLLLGLLGASGCAHPPHPVTEAELLGTWRNVNQRPDGPPDFPANQVFIRWGSHRLSFYSEHGFESTRLTPGGDSLLMRQGCFEYKRAVSFEKARSGSQDTLFVEHFGKYTRVDTATFFTTWRARTARHREAQRLFELRHGRVEETEPVAEQGHK